MTDQTSLLQRVKGALLKAAVTALGLPCRTYLPYVLLGAWNRTVGGWFSVFYCYAGSRAFIGTYAPKLFVEAFRWFPVPIGVLRHEGKLGLVIASPVLESEFLDPANAAAFRRLQERVRRVARIVGAERISLTGILPSVIADDGILNLPDTRPIVQRAVCGAVRRVMRESFPGGPVPILLLGGAGHIGVPIAGALREHGFAVHVIDPRAGQSRFPDNLRGRPCLVLDCSRPGVLESYLDQMWPGMVHLNEVFPRTPRRVIEPLTAQGIPCWHLSGLAGSIFPPLPHGYEGAVPCCAAHGASDEPEVVLVRLNPEIDVAADGATAAQAA
ncbi:MAG: hypothetical protein AAGD13_00830 [Pseudomonadota bacterium]